MTDLSNASPVESGAAIQTNGTEAVANGNIQQSGEARQSATASESFIPQGLNLNTLPPALKAEVERINNEMVRGFTAKTQKLAEEAKKYADYDTIKQKASQFEQISAQQEFVERWNAYVNEAQAKMNGQDEANDPIQAKISQIEKTLEQERFARQEAEVMTFLDAFSSAKDEKGNLLHPDFDALNDYKIGASKDSGEYGLLRACIQLAEGENYQEKVSNGYKAAKAVRDALIEEGRKQGMGRMLSKVRNSTEAPTITSNKESFNGDAKKLSVREARELAQRGVVVR